MKVHWKVSCSVFIMKRRSQFMWGDIMDFNVVWIYINLATWKTEMCLMLSFDMKMTIKTKTVCMLWNTVTVIGFRGKILDFDRCIFLVMYIIWQLNSVTKICHYSKRARTCHLLCNRPEYYHNTSKTHVRDRIFRLSPIHASMIFRFPEFPEFSESSSPFRENSIDNPMVKDINYSKMEASTSQSSQFSYLNKEMHLFH